MVTSSDILWVHHDALSRDHPVFAAAGDARPLFIWDAADIARRGWTLKRCVFVMECVDALDIDVVEGEAAKVLRGSGAAQVWMADTADIALQAAAEHSGLRVTTVAAPLLTDVPSTTDMGRFFRFWNKARRSALSPTAEIAEERRS